MRGFTGIEIVTLLLMMAVLVALVLVLAPTPQIHVEPKLSIDGDKLGRELVRGARAEAMDPNGISRSQYEVKKVECMHNVRMLVALIEIYPGHTKFRGANLLMFLVAKEDLEGEDFLKRLFCPGDIEDTWEDTGGMEAYAHLDATKKGEHGHLTSYAGRDFTNRSCAAKPGKHVVLICDDSEDHHGGKGFVVGYSGGSVKFRHKFEDWEMDVETPVSICEGSPVPELRCLVAD